MCVFIRNKGKKVELAKPNKQVLTNKTEVHEVIGVENKIPDKRSVKVGLADNRSKSTKQVAKPIKEVKPVVNLVSNETQTVELELISDASLVNLKQKGAKTFESEDKQTPLVNKNIKHNLNTNEYNGYCLFVSLNSNYIIGYRVFIQSFLQHNRWFDGDIDIMDLDLNDVEIEYIKSFYSKTIFIKPQYKNYEKVNTTRLYNRNFINNYYKLDIFSYTKYEKIVSMDCDMLVVDDLSELFEVKYKFGAVPVAFNKAHKIPPFNGGLIVLDSRFNSIENYNIVLDKLPTPYRFAEQDLLNDLYKTTYTKIKKVYNTEKRLLKSSDPEDLDTIKNVKVMHFVGAKPWDPVKLIKDLGYSSFEEKWHEYNIPKILVIGNSPTILEHKNSNIINTFDIIIRINDFCISGFEDYVGNKTHYVICTFATNITDEYRKMDPNNIYMFTAEKYGDEKFLVNRVKGINIKKINILDNYYLEGLNKKIGVELPKRSTSGLIAIEFALRMFKNYKVYIHGIELDDNENKANSAHYFKQDNFSKDKWLGSINKYHDISLERKYIRRLIKQKKIFKL